MKTTFLHRDLEEEIYMQQPEGLVKSGKEHLVCRLKKSLYGLNHTPRQWYRKFNSPSAPRTAPAPSEEEEEQRTSPQPKRRRLDRKNGKDLDKDATRPVLTLISESHQEVVFTGNTIRGKGA